MPWARGAASGTPLVSLLARVLLALMVPPLRVRVRWRLQVWQPRVLAELVPLVRVRPLLWLLPRVLRVLLPKVVLS